MANINQVVEVQIDRLTKLPTRVGFGTALVVDENTVQSAGDVDTFSEVQDLLDAGFSSGDEATKAFTALLSQNPRPVEARLARKETNVAKVTNIKIDTVANATVYTVTLDAIDFTFTSSGAATATEIRDGLKAVIGADPKFTVADVAADEFSVTAATAGLDYSVAVDTNMSLTVATANLGMFSELARIIETEPDWYFLISTSRASEDILEAARFIETQVKLYFFETDEANIKDQTASEDSTTVAFTLKSLSRERSAWIWTKTDNLGTYPSAAWVGKLGPKDPGTVTWKFKNLAGVQPDDELTGAQEKNIRDKNGNHYSTVAGQAIIASEAVVASGEFIDIMRGTDALSRRLQEEVFFVLLNEDKVDYTDKGVEQLVTAARMAADEFTGDGQLLRADPGVTFTTVPVAEKSKLDRGARIYDDISFEAEYAGAIHKTKISGRISV